MTDTGCGSFARLLGRQLDKTKICVTATLAGMLAFAPVAQARTTKIEILTRGVAFGGYSFPGVGQ
jgi:hypothetical protein